MTSEQSDAEQPEPDTSSASQNDPLSPRNIISGIIVTVVGGIILAFIIRDAAFSSDQRKTSVEGTPTVALTRIPSTLTTVSPNSVQIVNSTTVVASVEESTTLLMFDGDLFVTVNHANSWANSFSAIIGVPGCVNQEVKQASIGQAVLYECGSSYDIRAASVKLRSTWSRSIARVEFYVTKLNEQ